MISFKQAQPEHSDILGDIAIEAKGYWGYPREQLDIWRKDLKIEVAYIVKNTVKVIYSDSSIVGFFAIKQGSENHLDHLWLLPEAIGKGIGKLAFQEILSECKKLQIDQFFIISDPDAESFYLHLGAKRVGEIESIPQKRMLPKLQYIL